MSIIDKCMGPVFSVAEVTCSLDLTNGSWTTMCNIVSQYKTNMYVRAFCDVMGVLLPSPSHSEHSPSSQVNSALRHPPKPCSPGRPLSNLQCTKMVLCDWDRMATYSKILRHSVFWCFFERFRFTHYNAGSRVFIMVHEISRKFHAHFTLLSRTFTLLFAQINVNVNCPPHCMGTSYSHTWGSEFLHSLLQSARYSDFHCKYTKA